MFSNFRLLRSRFTFSLILIEKGPKHAKNDLDFDRPPPLRSNPGTDTAWPRGDRERAVWAQTGNSSCGLCRDINDTHLSMIGSHKYSKEQLHWACPRGGGRKMRSCMLLPVI